MPGAPTGGPDGPAAEEQRLLEAIALAGRPLPVAVGTHITGWTETELLAAGDRLTAEGRLAQTAEGLLPASPEVAEGIDAEIGALRLATVMGSLADAFAAGNAGPEVVGPYLAGAARWEEAVGPLSKAGLDAVEHRHLGEALPLLDRALEAVEHVRMDDHELRARLHLGRARCYRLIGQSEAAVTDATHAIRLSEGPALVHALEWRSRLADDQQHSQDADGYLAAAQLAAIADPGRLGELHSLRARTLGRIGFPLEAEASLDKGHTLLAEHGTEAERWQARYDEAWVAFDQGRARDAADRFASLATTLEDHQVAELADIEMWEARALFAAGSPTKALEVHSRAMARAQEIGAFGPVFLGHMALAEGAALYGAWDQSLESAEAMLAIVLESLPAWENAARFLKAQALTGLKRYDEAKGEISAGIAASPDGINGWRWRNRCTALQWRIDKLAGGKWHDLEPADLTEEFLASRFYLQAVELMVDRVGFEKDPELATNTAALALRVGLPVHAARALAGTDRWVEPEGVATAHHIKQVQVPEAWADDWDAVPGVATALAVQEGGDPTEAVQTLQADLEAAFESAGLHVDDRRLSPAQRSASGLRIKKPRQPRRRRRLASLASTAALLVAAGTVGGLVALTVSDGFPDDPNPGQGIVVTTTTTPPGEDPKPPEEVQLPIPDVPGFGAAQWSFRGETDREGFNGDRDGKSTRSGVDDLLGYWWKFNTNQPIDGSPVVRGSSVMIGSGSETFYVFDATTGNQLWTRDVDGPVTSSASFAFAPLGEAGENESVVFIA
ncbi:MAG: PQQ-binding-like beta-propeller repeat protein, partial [Acidimicrobiia bacterium]|nr:PQQ-binding-like beta-propeller repeat protein [Acidimicrobiia bacterium]